MPSSLIIEDRVGLKMQELMTDAIWWRGNKIPRFTGCDTNLAYGAADIGWSGSGMKILEVDSEIKFFG